MSDVDERDVRILTFLSQNGRAKLRQLAELLGITVPSVKNRVKKLERLRAIRGYVTIIDPSYLGLMCRAVIMIKLRFRDEASLSILQGFSKHSSVHSLYITRGRFDALMLCDFKNPEEVKKFAKAIKEKLGKALDYVEWAFIEEEVKECRLPMRTPPDSEL